MILYQLSLSKNLFLMVKNIHERLTDARLLSLGFGFSHSSPTNIFSSCSCPFSERWKVKPGKEETKENHCHRLRSFSSHRLLSSPTKPNIGRLFLLLPHHRNNFTVLKKNRIEPNYQYMNLVFAWKQKRFFDLCIIIRSTTICCISSLQNLYRNYLLSRAIVQELLPNIGW